jgi:hypothetical protein
MREDVITTINLSLNNKRKEERIKARRIKEDMTRRIQERKARWNRYKHVN